MPVPERLLPDAVPPPATRDQADAHRFGMRRLEAALVRADPVPVHEQLRSQRRAAVAGVLLALLGLVGAAVSAVVAPKPEWSRQDIVVARTSGAVFAVAREPDRLVPVPDVLGARLVLAALGGATSPVPEDPVLVRDADLAEAPRTVTAELPATPGVALGGPSVPGRWAVCDGPVVLAGTLGPVAPAGPLRVRAPGGAEYVLLDGVRHAVDPTEPAVAGALGLAGVPARPVGAEVLGAVPEGPPLRAPRIGGGSGPTGVPGRPGDVLATTSADGARRYLAVLPGGLQEVPATFADALRVLGGAGPREVGPAVVADVPRVAVLETAGWPSTAPAWSSASGTACATWVDGRAGFGVAPELPVARGAVPVVGGPVRVVVGGGGPVRAVSPGGGGTVWLISAAGTAYGVADTATAAALGLRDPPAAPEAMLRLLPAGPALDLAAARRAVLDPQVPGH